MQNATDKHASTRPWDDSGTFPEGPRAALIAALADGVKSAIAAGDIEAARVAWEAMGRLIGSAGGAPSFMIDLEAGRERRG